MFYYRLLQNIRYNSLFYTVNSWLLTYCIYSNLYHSSHTSNLSITLLVTISLFSLSMSLFLYTDSFILYSLLHLSVYKVFAFLCFTKHNILYVYWYCWKWKYFTFFNGWVIFHCVLIYNFLRLLMDTCHVSMAWIL